MRVRRLVAIADAHPATLRATAGVHPHDAANVADGWLESLEVLASRPAVVALGEMGLDFNRNYSPPAIQREVFAAQLELATRLEMPVFVHDRDSDGEVLELLLEHRRPQNCVVHCFTGSGELLDAYVAAGCYIGITGWICDERRGLELREVVHRIPEDRLLVETDAPYLMPRTIRPRPRTRRNEPANLAWVVAELASILNVPSAELARNTTANAKRLFRL